MDYRGLDFGTGISHLGDLLAKGHQDRIELARQQALDSQRAEEHTQQMGLREEAANQAAQKSNYDYGTASPRVTMVDAPDLAPISAPQTSQAGTQAAAQALQGQPGVIAPNSPMASTSGVTPGQAPLPQMGTSVDSNVIKGQIYQQALQHLAQTDPHAVDPTTGKLTPFAYHQAVALAERAAAIREKEETRRMYIEGRNNVANIQANSRQHNSRSEVDRANQENLKGLNQEEQKVLSNIMLSSDERDAQLEDIHARRDAIMGQISGKKSAQAPQASSDDAIWSSYLTKYPHTKNTPQNRSKVISALKGK